MIMATECLTGPVAILEIEDGVPQSVLPSIDDYPYPVFPVLVNILDKAQQQETEQGDLAPLLRLQDNAWAYPYFKDGDYSGGIIIDEEVVLTLMLPSVLWQNHPWSALDMAAEGAGTFNATVGAGPLSTTFTASISSPTGLPDIAYVNAQSGGALTYNGPACNCVCHFVLAKSALGDITTEIEGNLQLVMYPPTVPLIFFDVLTNAAGTYDIAFTVPDTAGETKNLGIALHIASGLNADVLTLSSVSMTGGYVQNATNDAFLSWTQTTVPTTNAIWRNQNGGGFTLLVTQAGALTTYVDPDPWIVGPPGYDYRIYKIVPSDGPESNVVEVAYNFAMEGIVADYPNLVAGYTYLTFSSYDVTSINLPKLKYVLGDASFEGQTLDDSMILPSLEIVSGSLLTNLMTATLISYPALISIGTSWAVDSVVVPTVSMPLLVFVGGDIILVSSTIDTLSLPSLVWVGSMIEASLCTVTEFSFPSLTTVVGNFLCDSCNNLAMFDMPVLTSVGGDIHCNSNPVLTTVNIPALVFHNGEVVRFHNCALSAASVNHILARAAASGVTSLTLQLEGGTNSPPTGVGITDKNALNAAGNTVTTN